MITLFKNNIGNLKNFYTIIFLIVFSSIFISYASAQSLKPLTVATDENGVDMISGEISTEVPILSIPADPTLTMKRLQDVQPLLSGKISTNPDPESSYQINGFQSTSDTFTCNSNTECRSSKKNGSQLWADPYGKTFYYYPSNSQGMKITFDIQNFNQGPLTGGTQFTFLPSTVSVDGVTLNYTYDVFNINGTIYRRPSTISSSLGYTLKITYAYYGNDLGTGWGTMSNAAIYKTSDMTTPLAKHTYNGDFVTDLAGRQWKCYGCSAASYAGSGTTPLMTVRLPGETIDNVKAVNEPRSYGNVSHSRWVTKVERDGAIYHYNYTAGYSAHAGFSKVQVTGPNGLVRTVNVKSVYNIPPVVTSIVDANGGTTSYEYLSGGVGVVSKITYPEGNSVQLSYDLIGNITEMKQIAKAGSGNPTLVTKAYYPYSSDLYCTGIMCSVPDWVEDPRGNRTYYTYNSFGRWITKIDPAGADGIQPKTIRTYLGGRMLSERICGQYTNGSNATCGTAQESVKELTYWESTRLPLTETITDGVRSEELVTQYSYDDAGRLLSVDGPMAGIQDKSYYRYDIAGRKTWEIGPADSQGRHFATRYTYRNADDQVLKVETGYISSPTSNNLIVQQMAQSDYNYRRLKSLDKTVAGGVTQSAVQYSYDAAGRLDCTAMRMNPAVYNNLPASACSLGTQGSNGADRITKNIYDAAGQLLQIRKGVGTPLEQAYATYSYTANGQQQQAIDANGNRTTYTYDGHDRLVKWAFPSKTRPTNYYPINPAYALLSAGASSTSDYESYSYDNNGNMLTKRKRDNTVLSYQYDALNRMTVKIVPSRGNLTAAQTRNVHYGYDNRGLMTKARFDTLNGEGVTTNYDGFGRITSSQINMGGLNKTLSYQYDKNGNRTRITHPDGKFFHYNYDSLDRMTQIKDSEWLWLTAHFYNEKGQYWRLLVNDSANSQNIFGYDDAGRLNNMGINVGGLLHDVTFTFGYNPASQIIQRTNSNAAYAETSQYNVTRNYVTNGLNQYNSAGSENFTYDANGNLTSDGGTNYIYDIENRLVSATGEHAAQLVYDPMGRLFSVTGGGATTKFLYDGDALVSEYNGSNALLRRYVHGAGVDNPLVWYEGSGTTALNRRHMFANWQGSITTITDGAMGNVIAINAYDAYGIGNDTNIGRFQYTGQAWLEELGMYHYKARIYSPTLGRFLQTDPIGYEDNINVYAYAGNDPVTFVDPSGEWKCGANSSKQCDAVAAAIKKAKSELWSTKDLKKSSEIRKAINAFGEKGEDNGVIVRQNVGTKALSVESAGYVGSDYNTVVYVNVNPTITDLNIFKDATPHSIGAVIAHEGSHILDYKNLTTSLGLLNDDLQSKYDSEKRAYLLTGQYNRAVGHENYLWSPSWGKSMEQKKMEKAAKSAAWRSVCKNGANCKQNLKRR